MDPEVKQDPPGFECEDCRRRVQLTEEQRGMVGAVLCRACEQRREDERIRSAGYALGFAIVHFSACGKVGGFVREVVRLGRPFIHVMISGQNPTSLDGFELIQGNDVTRIESCSQEKAIKIGRGPNWGLVDG